MMIGIVAGLLLEHILGRISIRKMLNTVKAATGTMELHPVINVSVLELNSVRALYQTMRH